MLPTVLIPVVKKKTVNLGTVKLCKSKRVTNNFNRCTKYEAVYKFSLLLVNVEAA
jgi:hypothetical protein